MTVEDYRSYASDAIYDAQEASGLKAINSFSFRELQNSLTQLWRFCYETISLLDRGYYSATIPLTKLITTLPPHISNSLVVYSAQHPVGFNRKEYTQSPGNTPNAPFMYHISGNDLYCRDALSLPMWLEFVPAPPMLTFTLHNRDPKILDEYEADSELKYIKREQAGVPVSPLNRYDKWDLIYQQGATEADDKYILRHKVQLGLEVDLTSTFQREEYTLLYEYAPNPLMPNIKIKEPMIILDYPYAFVSYKHIATGDYQSFVVKDLATNPKPVLYNPFDFQGRRSNVRYITAKYNDFTGMGVVVEDCEAPIEERYKELGFSPDTLLNYPKTIAYDYLVAHLAQRFALKNESTVMVVEKMVLDTELEMAKFLPKNKSGFTKIKRTAPRMYCDFI